MIRVRLYTREKSSHSWNISTVVENLHPRGKSSHWLKSLLEKFVLLVEGFINVL